MTSNIPGTITAAAADYYNAHEGTTYAMALLAVLPKGSTIYLILRHVSKSGMTRAIDPLVMVDGEAFYLRSAAEALGMKIDRKHDAVTVKGTGMDIGFHLVYRMGQSIHNDGYHFTHRWL